MQYTWYMTCFQGYIISLYSCLNYIALKLEQHKLFCCCSEEDYSFTIAYNCVKGVLIFLPFAFLSSGCHIHFQEFRNEMCDIPISGILLFFDRKMPRWHKIYKTLVQRAAGQVILFG